METMKVLYVEPKKMPKMISIEHTLGNLQKLVGGCIEAVYPWDDPVALVCNDNGIAEGLPLNRMIGWDTDYPQPIHGPFFICGLGEDDFTGLDDRLAEKYYRIFKHPEDFSIVKVAGRKILVWNQIGRNGASRLLPLN